MDSNHSLIELESITYAYEGGRTVLDHASFSFGLNERAGLIGANGSGKTTLFHLIMGLLHPSLGRVKIFGKERKRENDFHEVRAGIGFVFQDADDQLFCPTVLEDVAFGPLNLGLGRDETLERVKRALNLLGLEGFEDRITYKLSGGEKKLVALATVLAMNPKMLLLDEPTAGLDPDTTDRMSKVLTGLGLPYLIISHDHDFLAQTTDRLYKMEDHRVTPVER